MLGFWKTLGAAVLHQTALSTLLGGKDEPIAAGTDYRVMHERVQKPGAFLSRFEVSELSRLFQTPAVVAQAKKVAAQWKAYAAEKQISETTTPAFDAAAGLASMDTQWVAALTDPAANPEVPTDVIPTDEQVDEHLVPFLRFAAEGQPTTVGLLHELENVGWFDSCATSATYKVGYRHPYSSDKAVGV